MDQTATNYGESCHDPMVIYSAAQLTAPCVPDNCIDPPVVGCMDDGCCVDGVFQGPQSILAQIVVMTHLLKNRDNLMKVFVLVKGYIVIYNITHQHLMLVVSRQVVVYQVQIVV